MDGNDFILAAYSEYLRDAPEWPNIRNTTCELTRLSREGSEDATLFIRECFRLACTRDEKTGYYDFRLRNMMSLKLKNIRIFGKVMWIKELTNAIDLKVYDGTGVIKVYCGKHLVQNYEDVTSDSHRVDAKEDHQLDAEARRSDTIPDNYNRAEVNKVPSTAPLKVKGYMTAVGLPTFALTKNRADRDERNIWKRNMKPAIVFAAHEVQALTENEYVAKCTALAELFKQRHTRD